ncbi:hypothetical protein BDZ97DRAFT_1934731 [Flammula alnicola]|nr:hypothetical protein BDZ97DRAFT_1934731 [Flammula alnicola]
MEAGSTTPTTHWLILCDVKRRQRVAGVYLLRLIPQDPTYLIRLGSRSDRANMIFHVTDCSILCVIHRMRLIPQFKYACSRSLGTNVPCDCHPLSLSTPISQPHLLLSSSPDDRRAPFASSFPIALATSNSHPHLVLSSSPDARRAPLAPSYRYTSPSTHFHPKHFIDHPPRSSCRDIDHCTSKIKA